jgi:SPP1 gp7 family putative phage head morphogenesis protein
MAGQLFVEMIDLNDAPTKLALQDAPPAFVQLPFDEAVDFWRAFGNSDEDLDRILRGYRESASASADLFYDSLARSAVSQLQTHIESGGNMGDFIAAMRDESVSFGIEPASPAYLENVYRTNIATAYNNGRAVIMEDPDVLEEFPFAQFFATGDSRTRESHEALNGIVVRIGSDVYNRLRTPLSYQCRCSWASISQEDVDAEGLTITESLPEDMIPAGF